MHRNVSETSVAKGEKMIMWEYKLVFRQRGWSNSWSSLDYNDVDQWNVDIEKLLAELGDEGWELVTIEPRSDYIGPYCSGTTTSSLWVFKRPKADP